MITIITQASSDIIGIILASLERIVVLGHNYKKKVESHMHQQRRVLDPRLF